MEILLGIAVYTWLIQRLWAAARTEHELAKKGTVPPRMEAKYGGKAAAAMVAKYGFLDHLRDAWHDYWPRRTEALIAARDAKAANPGQKVRLRDRLTAAGAVITAGARKLVESAGWKPTVEPDPPAVPVPALAVDTGDVPEGTRRFTATGQEEYRDGRWQPVPKNPDSPPQPAKPAPSTGGTMTAPTGEAVNYETTVAELEALLKEQQMHLDACIGAQSALAAAKAFIGDMQESYRSSSAAAATTHEHLAVLHLDGATLADTGTTADAMPAGAVDTYYDQLEGMEAMAKERRDAAEVALHSTEAALGNIQAKYGDAATTVAGDLSGDARFLDSGTGTTVAA